MRAVRAFDTAPELVVRRFLHNAGLRYRLHVRELPGTPDLVFPARAVVVFVHGCFWHQHLECGRAARPNSHSDYWEKKLDRNVARDALQVSQLQSAGWNVEVIWECQTRDHTALENLLKRIQ